jgi:hypothetical protein
MDDLKKLAQGFVNAAKAATPTSYIPEVANYAKAAFLDPITKQGVQAGGTLAGERGKEADQADEAARQKKMNELKDQLDPSKYSRVQKADGGFAFYDPSGKEIDISKYSQFTGQTRAQILKDSENPIDQEYVNDYNNMNQFAQAIYNNDTDTVNSFRAQNPALARETPQTIMSLLIKKYPHIYGKGSYQQTFNNRNQSLFANNPNYIGTGTGPGGL